jgi:hypothetical protein
MNPFNHLERMDESRFINKCFTSIHWKAGVEDVDHGKYRRTTSDLNLGVGRVR